MRCPQCNRFVPYDAEVEPEEQDAPSATDSTFTASYRRVLNCDVSANALAPLWEALGAEVTFREVLDGRDAASVFHDVETVYGSEGTGPTVLVTGSTDGPTMYGDEVPTPSRAGLIDAFEATANPDESVRHRTERLVSAIDRRIRALVSGVDEEPPPQVGAFALVTVSIIATMVETEWTRHDSAIRGDDVYLCRTCKSRVVGVHDDGCQVDMDLKSVGLPDHASREAARKKFKEWKARR